MFLGNLGAFIAEPWTIIAIWQGGLSVWAGAAAAVIVIGVMLGRKPSGFALVAAAGGLVLLHLGAATLIAPAARPMPRLPLTDTDGKPVELDIQGPTMVINLCATWCSQCRTEERRVGKVCESSCNGRCA